MSKETSDIHALKDGKLVPGVRFSVSASVRISSSNIPSSETSQPVYITLAIKQDAGSETTYQRVTDGVAYYTKWSTVQGSFVLAPSQLPPSQVVIYVEGPRAGVNIILDDVYVYDSDWKKTANQQIEQERKRDFVITVLNDQGTPMPGMDVRLWLTDRAFGFGTAVSAFLTNNASLLLGMTAPAGSGSAGINLYADWVARYAQWITFENEAKWYTNEPARGVLRYEDSDRMVAWAGAQRKRVRGHCVLWSVDAQVQPWVQALASGDLSAAVDSRTVSVVSRYQGKMAHWDVNNEMLHGSFFKDRGIPPADGFKQVNKLDPSAKLFTNDYNIISDGASSDEKAGPDRYLAQIKDLLLQGAPIHGVGVQGHFTNPDPYQIRQRLDTLDAGLPRGTPVWLTEVDTVEANELVRADELEVILRTAFAHPRVEGIVLWGFWAGEHWRGPTAALVDTDWRVNAAGQRWIDLTMSEWTTTLAGVKTDGNGQLRSRGFHGTYQITVSCPGTSQSRDMTFVLERGKPAGVSAASVGPRNVTIIVPTSLCAASPPVGTDCVVSRWSEWTECSNTCGVGEQMRQRDVVVPPSGAGLPCPPLQEIQACQNVNPCPYTPSACVTATNDTPKCLQWSGDVVRGYPQILPRPYPNACFKVLPKGATIRAWVTAGDDDGSTPTLVNLILERVQCTADKTSCTWNRLLSTRGMSNATFMMQLDGPGKQNYRWQVEYLSGGTVTETWVQMGKYRLWMENPPGLLGECDFAGTAAPASGAAGTAGGIPWMIVGIVVAGLMAAALLAAGFTTYRRMRGGPRGPRLDRDHGSGGVELKLAYVQGYDSSPGSSAIGSPGRVGPSDIRMASPGRQTHRTSNRPGWSPTHPLGAGGSNNPAENVFSDSDADSEAPGSDRSGHSFRDTSDFRHARAGPGPTSTASSRVQRLFGRLLGREAKYVARTRAGGYLVQPQDRTQRLVRRVSGLGRPDTTSVGVRSDPGPLPVVGSPEASDRDEVDGQAGIVAVPIRPCTASVAEGVEYGTDEHGGQVLQVVQTMPRFGRTGEGSPIGSLVVDFPENERSQQDQAFNRP
eukprot:jgi/Mesvir1/28244/Mv04785-RA.1